MFILPWGLFTDLLGWREKCGLVSPPFQSHLGQPQVPWKEEGRGLVVGLKKLFFLPENLILLNFQRKQDDKVSVPDQLRSVTFELPGSGSSIICCGFRSRAAIKGKSRIRIRNKMV
jgi:hypothetical protein